MALVKPTARLFSANSRAFALNRHQSVAHRVAMSSRSISSVVRDFREKNSQQDLKDKHVLVVGGTQGIGAATAKRFASLGASVTITGRDKSRGNYILETLRKSTPSENHSPQHTFETLEVTKLGNLKQFVQSFSGKHSQTGLHALILCAGGLNYGPRRETEDGVEMTFAMNILSRFLLTHELQPLLAKAPGGRVVNVLGAGNGSNDINVDDLELKNGFNFIRAASLHATINDLLTKQFAKRYSDAAFYHFFPGMVNTNGPENNRFPWFVTLPAKIVMPLIATPPEDVAEVITYVATSPEFGTPRSGALLGPKANDAKQADVLNKPEVGKKVWDYMIQRAGLSS
ncbi:hypothetical protein HK097_007587 [Rhizophlyctis rosea]|uniref:NAD(P)-binding protein n=1 Tax=Rhizophlyctis rosea TaxID=64517 RepID=A0AAD5SND0_9FUNG|nr:hypothetical protein HK097_007587 [Rhizophlyctis rosea]